MPKIKITLSELVILLAITVFLHSCLTSKKMEQFVAGQYGNKLPVVKKKDPALIVHSTIPFTPEKNIDVTEQKTSKVLPLIVYIHFDYRHTCTLNPAIAVNSFTTTVNQESVKLKQKLNGRQLELTVEQVPNAFAIVDKAGMILFFIHWDKVYVEPETKDLVVSYKVLDNGTAFKTRRITIKNEEQNRGIRFGQSWRSSTTEYLSQYNADMVTMSKNFVNKLLQEL